MWNPIFIIITPAVIFEAGTMRNLLTVCTLIAVLSPLPCCSSGSREPHDPGRIGVVVSIPPLAEFVRMVGDDRVRVTVMVPPGASPHTYEPLPSQLREVSRAGMYVKVGSGIEFERAWMDKLIDVNEHMRVVDCARGVKLAGIAGRGGHDHPGRTDPHIWLSPPNANIMVQNIFEGLAGVDPDHRETYSRNADAYRKKLDELDRSIRRLLAGNTRREIIVYHPAWGYFCREYGLIQVPVEEEGKEPSPKRIARLIERAGHSAVKVIFAAPEFNSESAEVIAKEIGGEVIPVSPLEESYRENLQRVAEAFSRALQ